jgi:hypothetical protein
MHQRVPLRSHLEAVSDLVGQSKRLLTCVVASHRTRVMLHALAKATKKIRNFVLSCRHHVNITIEALVPLLDHLNLVMQHTDLKAMPQITESVDRNQNNRSCGVRER